MTCAAALARHGYITNVFFLNLQNIDITSAVCRQCSGLSTLTAGVHRRVYLDNVVGDVTQAGQVTSDTSNQCIFGYVEILTLV